MAKLDGKYNIENIEKKYQHLWDQAEVYKWCGMYDFVIDTPPPTISGALHMGHAFSYCHTDFIARYQRMQGKDVFYPMGFDDNGLPTERLVEKKHKVRAHNVGRAEFIKLCHQVSEEHRIEFRQLFKAIGLSVDWRQEYHTISDDCRALSQMSFLDLYNKGAIYQKSQPMLWDVIDQTAISQAEIEDKEFSSHMNYIRFTTSIDHEELIIATTRPELLPACVAIFVHPEDKRYQHLIGRTALTPLFNDEVPIIADDNVKIDKGSGIVMCCTFGDEMDIHWWNTHFLPMKIIIDKYGKICDLPNDNQYSSTLVGFKVKEARTKIIDLLKKNNYVQRQEEITHQVKCAERSGAPLEILPTKQWFVKVLQHKDELLQRVHECNWHPQNKRIIMEQWIEGLRWDWCISRQRYFGVPFPVWYSKRPGEEGKVIIADKKQLPIDPLQDIPAGYSKDEVIAESDVMDTWATSSISPQLNSRILNDDYYLESKRQLFPATLRPQAHEIIRTWAFYTIVKSHLHAKSIPWSDLMISGWCLAEDKSKMSKSKGNIVEPHKLLEQYGADVIRYWASNARLGADTIYSENIMKMGKRLVTKLWNAGKFISNFIIEDFYVELINAPIDNWILHRLHDTVKSASAALDKFEYCTAREIIEDFFWKDYCDNYLELVKARAYQEDAPGHESAIHALSYTFEIILKLFAPFIPFVTEEIYNNLYSCFSIHRRDNWPNYHKIPTDKSNVGDTCLEILRQVREFKSKKEVSIKVPIKYMSVQTNNKEIMTVEFDIKNTCNVETINWDIGEYDTVVVKEIII